MLDAAAKAVQQADPTTPGAGLLPDVDYQRATSAVVAKAAYRAAVEDTKTHYSVVQAIFDTKWRREYHQRVLQ
jgi:malate dehydrogenase (oxaloacetate-decarboxylating)